MNIDLDLHQLRPDLVAADLITAHSATNHPATFFSAELLRILRRAVELHRRYVAAASGPVASRMHLWHGDDGIEHRFSVVC